jgi:hypothetical protein
LQQLIVTHRTHDTPPGTVDKAMTREWLAAAKELTEQMKRYQDVAMLQLFKKQQRAQVGLVFVLGDVRIFGGPATQTLGVAPSGIRRGEQDQRQTQPDPHAARRSVHQHMCVARMACTARTH